MTITIKIDDGRSTDFEADSLTIGSDASCDISFPGDARLLAVHARLKKVFFQWRLDAESPSECSISIAEKYGASGFLQAGDRISLSVDGPFIVFRPRDEPEEDADETSGDTDAEAAVAEESVGAESVEQQTSDPGEEQIPAPEESPPIAAPIVDPEIHFESAPPIAAPLANPVLTDGEVQEPIPAIAVSQLPMAQAIANPIDAPAEIGISAEAHGGLALSTSDSGTRPARRNDGSPVGVIISAALGGLTVFGLYKLLLALGVI